MQIAYKPARRIYGKTKGKIQTQSKVPPIDFHAKTGLAVEYSISGNMTQASTQEYSITDIPPIDFQSDGSGISDYSIYGNMVQATSQQYSLTGTSPLSFKSDANTLSAWSIAGNMTQTGTPTPDAPIMPDFCGVRTANMMPAGEKKTVVSNDITFDSDGSGRYRISGTASADTSVRFNLVSGFTTPISVSNGGQGTLSFFNTQKNEKVSVDFYNGTTKVDDWKMTPRNRTNVAYNIIGNKYVDNVMITVTAGSTVDMIITPEFTNDGVLPTEFETYGWAEKITCAGQTTPVYLGQVSTVRRIKKVVLTGEEKWQLYQSDTGIYGTWQFYFDNAVNGLPFSSAMSNIAGYGVTATTRSSYQYGVYLVTGGTGVAFQMAGSKDTFPTITSWKSYLAQQYAAGTPVTVWYVLAEPTTGIVNEPLCKIGDYADELHSEDAGVTIPTITGDNTLSIDTTLSPSSVSITTTSGVWTENPIIPEEVGERTWNLFPLDATKLHVGRIENDGTIDYEVGTITVGTDSVTYQANATWRGFYTDYIQADENATLTFSPNDSSSMSWSCICYDENDNFLGRATAQSTASIKTFTTLALTKKVRIAVTSSFTEYTVTNPMLNTGSTALPYEPYNKYKIPVTNAGTTTNIYALEPLRKIGDYADVIGSMGTVTRRIKKLVFTGTENVSYNARSDTYGRYAVTIPTAGGTTTPENVICTHFKTVNTTTKPLSEGGICMRSTGVDVVVGGTYTEIGVTSPSDSATITSAVKSYLAAQYAAGIPVTVWYVLTTAQTETITSPTISTVSGTNTLSIGTTLQPSNVSLTTSSSVYPLNPIIPEEVGDRTGNLFDINSTTTDENGNICNGIELPAGKYCITNNSNAVIYWRIGISTTSSSQINPSAPYVYINANDTLVIWVGSGNNGNIMVNSGNVALPYEPYGYKIPLNLNNTISNIYLSQPIRKIGNYSDSIDYENGTVTRQIKKLVLTGTENISNSKFTTSTKDTSNIIAIRFSSIGMTDIRDNNDSTVKRYMYDYLMCSHYGIRTDFDSTSYRYLASGEFGLNSLDTSNMFLVFSTDAENIDAFKSYLAQQYSNGNPVTVYYVLATPEVEQITPPTITPSIESNTISVDTTLQPSNLSITYTSPDYSEIKLVYDNQGNILYNDPPYHDWGAVRWIVRQGLGPQYYPIGYIFYDNFNPETGTAFQVVAHDNHFDPALTAQGYTHSMTLCEVLLDDVITMDAIEAFLYTNQAIPAGTYKFTIPNYDASYGGNKTYYFTSTAELQANSQIVMNWPYNQTPKTVTGYAPTASLTAMENTTAETGWNALTLTEWVDGTSPAATDLGTIAGPATQAGSSSYGQMNHIHRARYGSNNYLQSGARQYLNSDKAANAWWQPQTIFDRPYGSINIAGKLTKLSTSFVDVLATPTIQSRTNSYFETTSLDGTTFTLSTNYDITTDKLFLLSPMEVGFSTTDTTVGTLLDYYIDATNDTRIKKRKSNNTAYYWWLRTPYPSTANYVRTVNSSGALYGNYARGSYGIPAAACIQ